MPTATSNPTPGVSSNGGASSWFDFFFPTSGYKAVGSAISQGIDAVKAGPVAVYENAYKHELTPEQFAVAENQGLLGYTGPGGSAAAATPAQRAADLKAFQKLGNVGTDTFPDFFGSRSLVAGLPNGAELPTVSSLLWGAALFVGSLLLLFVLVKAL